MNNNTDEIAKRKFDHFYLKLLIILLLAFSVRIYISFFSGLSWFQTDTFDYFDMADAILAGHPYSAFPNGYPILIAITKTFFRPGLVPSVLISLNVVFSTLIVWMTTVMAKKMTGSELMACVAGFGIALYPIQLNYVRLMLTEVPTTFLLTLSVFLLLRRNYFSSGLSFCLTTLLRSSALPVLPILIGYYLFHPNPGITKRQAVSYLVGLMTVLTLYSGLIVCGVVKTSSNLTVNLLTSSKPYNQGDNFFSIDRFTIEEKQNPLRTYINFALNNPVEYVRQRLLSLQELWGWPVTVDHIGVSRSIATKIVVSVRIPLIVLVIIGFWRGPRDYDTWILFSPIIAITSVHFLMHSSPRYTTVVEPCLIVLAVVSLKQICMKSLTQ